MTTRNAAQKICSQRPWKIRRKTRMLPIAPSKPITAYNTATTSPPMNWLLDPAPAIRFCSNAESNFLLQLSTKRSEQLDERASVHPCDHIAPQKGLRLRGSLG